MQIASLARPRFRRRASVGFTFLEIMFVVVIIGILLAIAGPRLTGKTKKAQEAATRQQLQNYRTALAAYEMDTGEFPTTSQGLKALMERPSDVDETKWDGPYLDSQTGALPKDGWGREYQFRQPGENNKDYDLWSMGKDGQDNTTDDITNWSGKETSK